MGKIASGLVVLVMLWFATGGPERAKQVGEVAEQMANMPDAPAGALEYFGSPDGDMSLTLYSDRLSAVGFSTYLGEKGDMDIAISEIRSVKTFGSKFIIYSNDNSMLEFIIYPAALARSFEDRINELRG